MNSFHISMVSSSHFTAHVFPLRPSSTLLLFTQLFLCFWLTTFCKSYRCIIASLNWRASAVDVMETELWGVDDLLWWCQTFTLELPKLIINDMLTNISYSERERTNFLDKQKMLSHEVQVCNKVDPSWHWNHLRNNIKNLSMTLSSYLSFLPRCNKRRLRPFKREWNNK